MIFGTFDSSGFLKTTFATPSGATFIGGAAYNSDGELHITTATPAATDPRIGGVARKITGEVYVTATTPTANNSVYHGGLRISSDGAIYVTAGGSVAQSLNGLPMSTSGQLVVATSSATTPDLQWESDSGVTGDPVSEWLDSASAVSVSQGTAANRPAVSSGAFGSVQGIAYDGSNDILSITSKPLTSTAAGSCSIVFKTAASIAAGVLVSQSDSAVASTWVEVGINSSGKCYIEYNNAGTKHTVTCPTVLSVSTAYNLIITYDGTDYYAQLNGVEENPLVIDNVGTFAWFGAIGGTTAFSIGGTVTSGGTVRPTNCTVGAVYFWTTDISE